MGFFLGPAVSKLTYWNRDTKFTETSPSKKCGRSRKLCLMNELFLTLIRLRVGLLVADLAFRFGISKSHVTRIVITWIQFLYL